MENQKDFSYWKNPWQKWVVLAAGIVQIPLAIEKIKEYNFVVHAGIFSPEKLSEYMMQQKFSCMVSVLCAVSLIGMFLIATFVRNTKAANLAQVLLVFGAAMLLTIGLIFWGQHVQWLWLWIGLACILWVGGIFAFDQFRKQARKQ